MKIHEIIKKIKQIVLGPLAVAKKDGLVAGEEVTVMSGCSFGSEPYLIKLGSRVRISADVRFITHDGGTWAFRREEEYKDIVRFGKIEVGDDTFIGARAIIMPGVRIGKNCVIGVSSVVTHDVPDRMVVAGIPARVLCTTDEYAERCKKKMPQDFDMEKYHENKKEYLNKIL